MSFISFFLYWTQQELGVMEACERVDRTRDRIQTALRYTSQVPISFDSIIFFLAFFFFFSFFFAVTGISFRFFKSFFRKTPCLLPRFARGNQRVGPFIFCWIAQGNKLTIKKWTLNKEIKTSVGEFAIER